MRSGSLRPRAGRPRGQGCADSSARRIAGAAVAGIPSAGCGTASSVGTIGFRWSAPGTPDLPPTCLGHIGYAVVPWKRGRGYATAALAQMLPLARECGLPYVYVTTQPDNVPSQRVILANGGVLVERFTQLDAHGGGGALRYRIDHGREGTLTMLLQRLKPLAAILAEGSEREGGLRRSLGAGALTAMGIGCIIGTGIFVLTGVASATRSGPSLTISFVIAGIVSALAKPQLCRSFETRFQSPESCLYVHVRDARGAAGLDRRVGTRPRVCARSRDRQRRLVGVFHVYPAHALQLEYSADVATQPLGPDTGRRQSAGCRDHPVAHRAPDSRHQGVEYRQRGDRRYQSGRGAVLHRRRRTAHQSGELPSAAGSENRAGRLLPVRLGGHARRGRIHVLRVYRLRRHLNGCRARRKIRAAIFQSPSSRVWSFARSFTSSSS